MSSNQTFSDLHIDILSIKDLDFSKLKIPEYQRPYKWTAKNVGQLINDVITFQYQKQYRLGTLVLHDNDIVDGQQRIITLSLLLYKLLDKHDPERKQYKEVYGRLQKFWEQTQFSNRISIANIRENVQLIQQRLPNLDTDFLKFVLEKCQFVVVGIGDLSEAFQFFDSQNARGKDLEAHDLLKAFHLRELDTNDRSIQDSIRGWEEIPSKDLADTFLMMYRIKRWSQGKSAKFFTKDDIGAFKGISLPQSGVNRSQASLYPFALQQFYCQRYIALLNTDFGRILLSDTPPYPFQLDSPCLNGSLFFEMVLHYHKLYTQIREPKTFGETNGRSFLRTTQIVELLNTYPDRRRVGDQYTRELFDALLLYYADRFGFTRIDEVVPILFRYAYQLRQELSRVYRVSIDNRAKDSELFGIIRDAQTPDEVLSVHVPPLKLEGGRFSLDTRLLELGQ